MVKDEVWTNGKELVKALNYQREYKGGMLDSSERFELLIPFEEI